MHDEALSDYPFPGQGWSSKEADYVSGRDDAELGFYTDLREHIYRKQRGIMKQCVYFVTDFLSFQL
jgi:hypothetical protein